MTECHTPADHCGFPRDHDRHPMSDGQQICTGKACPVAAERLAQANAEINERGRFTVDNG
jgi:hypothetical protein